MSDRSIARFRWCCAITIFLSAFLLFQVQPIISKMILPWFGGGPAVWTTCMLFFQCLLLAGYAYAHGVHGRKDSSWRTGLHVALLVGAALLLPITPRDTWKPADGTWPAWRILTLLLVYVGLPYFMLSTTGPLVQTWYRRVFPDRSPYRLFALSNVGSLLALLSYPFLVEPYTTTNTQGLDWSVLFAAFVVICATLAVWAHRATATAARAEMEVEHEPTRTDENDAVLQFIPISIGRRTLWLLLPALASVMLLAVTNYVCQDIAVVPFFWVVPLALYLISFIICFDRAIWYRRGLFATLAAVSILVVTLLDMESSVERFIEKMGDVAPRLLFKPSEWLLGWHEWFYEFTDNLVVEAICWIVMLFLVCMICHGELARLKPHASRLTDFYLMVSAGGALGGVLVGLICPWAFSAYAELPAGVIASFLVAVTVLWDTFWTRWLLRAWWRKSVMFVVGIGALLMVVQTQVSGVPEDTLVMRRNFYGVLTVEEANRGQATHILKLLNGRILHGSQFHDPLLSRIPTTYYNDASGIGTTLINYESNEPLRVGVVGLGTGSIAAYGDEDDYFCFYEINPNVPELAKAFFTYLSNSSANIEIALGDARLSMERQPPQDFDVLALDAFSGDAIPAHLLTKEAFDEYLRHLNPNGVIAVHISNRHLDLIPVVGGIAEHFNLPAILISAEDGDGEGDAGSDWVLLTRNESFLQDPIVSGLAEEVQGTYEPVRLWTDQYSNLFHVLR